jgi:hypothetical protein
MHPIHSVIRPHNPRKPAFMEKCKHFTILDFLPRYLSVRIRSLGATLK